jgi:hypothetical protein
MNTDEIIKAELKPDAIEEHEDDPGMVQVTITIEREQVGKLMAFMNGDSWEKAQAIRKQDLKGCRESLAWCVEIALNDYNSTAVRIAAFLASLYNGNRVKVDVSGIGNFDAEHFEHLMNVLRLCHQTHREPHTFFKEGGRLFEQIIDRHGLGKRGSK